MSINEPLTHYITLAFVLRFLLAFFPEPSFQALYEAFPPTESWTRPVSKAERRISLLLSPALSAALGDARVMVAINKWAEEMGFPFSTMKV